jgi:hypothetical protein
MTQIFSLKDTSDDFKIQLLAGLGYGSDGIYVLDSDGNKHIDKYINEPVKINNMAILPGSTIIIDNNPLSIAAYLEEYELDI